MLWPQTRLIFSLGSLMTDEFLHFGVKGMRWGNRRQREIKSGTPRKQYYDGKDQTKTTYNTSLFAKRSKKMTDKELEDRLKRIRMEKEYSKLVNRDLTPYIDFASSILQAAATSYVSSTVSARYGGSSSGHNGRVVMVKGALERPRKQLTR